jgi:tRNA(Ile)-lysidine synthase
MATLLLDRFKAYISAEGLWKKGDSWLVAVSGGLDSTVLTHLCAAAEIDFRMAHCNFQLRGAESERDEKFVRSLAEKYNCPLSVRRFDTEAYRAERGISVQVAARELRYAWFRTFAVDAIATAHHLDDNIETLLMNFFKGTGIAGLRGMLPLQEGIVRPLLFASRQELADYAAGEDLSWVEDGSNATDKYNRNFVRHQLVPLLEQRYPSVLDNLGDNLPRFREVEVLYRQALDVHRAQLLERVDTGAHPLPGLWQISVIKLRKAVPQGTVIYELLRPFGFTPAQSGEVQALLDSTSGHYITSATHRILRDRKMLILSPLSDAAPAPAAAAPVVLDEGADKVQFPGGVLLQSKEPLTSAPLTSGPLTPPALALIPADPRSALLDAAHIRYPLILRRWKAGDYFYPLGMKKKKKLSRFFIDCKLSLVAKEQIWVLESDGRILWVVGQRIDDRFRVTAATRHLVSLRWIP